MDLMILLGWQKVRWHSIYSTWCKWIWTPELDSVHPQTDCSGLSAMYLIFELWLGKEDSSLPWFLSIFFTNKMFSTRLALSSWKGLLRLLSYKHIHFASNWWTSVSWHILYAIVNLMDLEFLAQRLHVNVAITSTFPFPSLSKFVIRSYK